MTSSFLANSLPVSVNLIQSLKGDEYNREADGINRKRDGKSQQNRIGTVGKVCNLESLRLSEGYSHRSSTAATPPWFQFVEHKK